MYCEITALCVPSLTVWLSLLAMKTALPIHEAGLVCPYAMIFAVTTESWEALVTLRRPTGNSGCQSEAPSMQA